MSKYVKFLLANKYLVIVIAIFLCELFLRFYQMETKNPFGFDQVSDAWAAKNIIVNHQFPLVGAVAKGNSGIYVGPLYRYFSSLFYWIFNLNPIASPIIAGITSIFTFWVIYLVFKKLFSVEIATVAVFINTFFLSGIIFDRTQWPVNFIPAISLLIFYFLYRIILGDVKKMPYLAILLGVSFSIHFTSIFYPILIVLALPFFPRNRKTFKYILISIPLFLFFLIPNITYIIMQKSGESNFASYFSTYFHGFHLKRVIQLAGDGLIQFNSYLYSDRLEALKFVLFPLFFIIYLYKSISKPKIIFSYLVMIWFIVPWFVFATYRGELTDYYFSINRYIALFIVAYFFIRIWLVKNIIAKLLMSAVLIYVAVLSLFVFFPYKDVGLLVRKETAANAINQKKTIGFKEGFPESYLYYYIMRQKGVKDVYK